MCSHELLQYISPPFKVGVSVKRVAIINDDFEEIRDEVRRQAHLFDLVITSGGVGPTHDDVVRPIMQFRIIASDILRYTPRVINNNINNKNVIHTQFPNHTIPKDHQIYCGGV